MLAFNIVFLIGKRAVSEAWRFRTLAQERDRIESVKVLRSCQQCEREASAEDLERQAGTRLRNERSGVIISLFDLNQ